MAMFRRRDERGISINVDYIEVDAALGQQEFGRVFVSFGTGPEERRVAVAVVGRIDIGPRLD